MSTKNEKTKKKKKKKKSAESRNFNSRSQSNFPHSSARLLVRFFLSFICTSPSETRWLTPPHLPPPTTAPSAARTGASPTAASTSSSCSSSRPRRWSSSLEPGRGAGTSFFVCVAWRWPRAAITFLEQDAERSAEEPRGGAAAVARRAASTCPLPRASSRRRLHLFSPAGLFASVFSLLSLSESGDHVASGRTSPVFGEPEGERGDELTAKVRESADRRRRWPPPPRGGCCD